MLPYDSSLREPARQLRSNMTDAERRLWAKVRMRQLGGYQFYRQRPIGDYIVDFFCPKAKLVVEVDGGQHFSEEAAEYDRVRDEYLRSLGLTVLRFTNAEVMTRLDSVVESVLQNLNENGPGKIPLSPPFSKGETPASPFVKGRKRGISGG